MRSLFHPNTLTITTAVLALISCATHTQALEGRLTGPDNPNSYGRQYMNQVAANEGLSKPVWYGGGTNEFSFAKVTYNRQAGFLKCIPRNDEQTAFDRLLAARETLTGINGEYRDHVAYPLTRVEELWDYLIKKDYGERTVFINQIMPQILKGSIYLYNAGIKHKDLHVGNIMVQEQANGQLKAIIIDFDKVEILPHNRQLININTAPTMGITGPSSPYFCYNFHQAPLTYIPFVIEKGMLLDRQNITPDDRMKIREHIKERAKKSPQATEENLDKAVDAYVTLLRVAAILARGRLPFVAEAGWK
ncbi:hypothetical protein BDF22DRAFT_775887 [Syncephalis plumigaleata]|nr:hypothetical protein BDF22DRAFT_775887 [Syncephalis plumigaleata]